MKKLITCFLYIILLFSGCGMPEQQETVSGGSEPLTNSVSESEPELPSSPKPSSELEVPAPDWIYLDKTEKGYSSWYWLSDTERLNAIGTWEPILEPVTRPALEAEKVVFIVRKYDISANDEHIIFKKEFYIKELGKEWGEDFSRWGIETKFIQNTEDTFSLILFLYKQKTFDLDSDGNIIVRGTSFLEDSLRPTGSFPRNKTIIDSKCIQYTFSKKDWSVIEELPLDDSNISLLDMAISSQGDFLKYAGDNFHVVLGSIYKPNEQYEAWNRHANTGFFEFMWSKDGEYFAALNNEELEWGKARREGRIVPEQGAFGQWDVFSRYGVYQYSVVGPWDMDVYWCNDNTLYFESGGQIPRYIVFDDKGNQVADITFEYIDHGNHQFERIISGTYDPRMKSKGIFRTTARNRSYREGAPPIVFYNFETGELNAVENIDVPSDVEYISFNPSGAVCFWARGESPSFGISKVK